MDEFDELLGEYAPHLKVLTEDVVTQTEPALQEAQQYFNETKDLYDSYIKGDFEHKKALKELNDLRKEAVQELVDNGVNVKLAKRALRNVKDQVDENSEDAVIVEGLEQMIMASADYMAELVQ